MKPPALLAVCVLLAGCAHRGSTFSHSGPDAGMLVNAQAYDAFVINRTDQLVHEGRSRSDAFKQADKEAAGRYGTRVSGNSTSTTAGWTSAPPQKSGPSLAELDAAVAGMKRK
jgi:hypothetical protein